SFEIASDLGLMEPMGLDSLVTATTIRGDDNGDKRKTANVSLPMEWLSGFQFQHRGNLTMPELMKELNKKKYLCTGCGRRVPLYSTQQHPVFFVPSAQAQFVFHDEECTRLRKLKEVIRLFVFYAEVRKIIAEYKPPETLEEQIYELLKVRETVLGLTQFKSLPLPTLPQKKEESIVTKVMFRKFFKLDQTEFDKANALKFNRERKVTALHISRYEQFRRNYKLKGFDYANVPVDSQNRDITNNIAPLQQQSQLQSQIQKSRNNNSNTPVNTVGNMPGTGTGTC
ncbi:hypothetical protein RFI_05996, partial [Reticulomyxa filosa]